MGKSQQSCGSLCSKIASECEDMDATKAYILGLLHDIGRKFGTRHLGHVYDGYKYMLSLGYDEESEKRFEMKAGKDIYEIVR